MPIDDNAVMAAAAGTIDGIDPAKVPSNPVIEVQNTRSSDNDCKKLLHAFELSSAISDISILNLFILSVTISVLHDF